MTETSTRSAAWGSGDRLARVGCFLLLILSACASSQKPATVTAFVGANVLTMSDEAALVLADHTVVVDRGRILALGPRATTHVPRGSRVIDASGKYLMPGFVDMHVHLEHIEDPAILDLFVASGVTTVRNMDGRPFILEWKQQIEEGVRRGPRIITAGPILDGDPPILTDNLAIGTPADATAAVVEQSVAGYDFIKVYTNLGADAYREVVTTAAGQGLHVTGHIPRGIDLDEALRSQRTIEHVTSLGRWVESDDSPLLGRWSWMKLHLAVPVSREKTLDIASAISRASVAVVPTLTQSDRALPNDETMTRWLAAPEMDVISNTGREAWRDSVRQSTARMDAEDWSAVAAGSANRGAVVRELHAAGVLLLAGTDTPNAFVVPGVSLHEEMENLVAAGLAPAEALAAATRLPPRVLGEDDWGSIRPGARADLVLLGKNPVEDIRHTRDIVGVMLRGEWIPAPALEEMRAAVRIP